MFRKSLLCASLLFVGCGQLQEDAFRDGLPSKEMVEMKKPGGTSGQGLESDSVRAFGQGDQSEAYRWTRDATDVVNGGTRAVLNLIEEITEYPPTTIEGNVAVWGPHTEALKDTTWKLTVTEESEHKYSYKLEGKAKQAADTEFKVIISGSHEISTDEQGNRLRNYGTGAFKIDWDAAQTLPDHDDNVGNLEVRYTRLNAAAEAKVEAAFRNVKDGKQSDTRVNADYKYKEAPGAGGEFEFALLKDMDTDPARSLIEKLTIKSRWGQSGAGRADVKISGGDFLLASATINECWDANFASQYLEASWAGGPSYGTVEACGSFSTAVYVTP
ncbi:MAG: hypothetical protein JXB05_24905 [Myxococcaceae bacterium]|nr:hypothetical protein [Myxococcaceae bacterium]